MRLSKYLPLNILWRFSKDGRGQWKSFWYRLYINIFGIFLRIPILPMGFSWKWKTFDIYYKGDDLVCFWKKGKLKYQSIISCGEFNSLKEIDKFWGDYNKFVEDDLGKIDNKKHD